MKINNGATYKPEVLFGPYGTRLESIGAQIGEPRLADPHAILNGSHCIEAVQQVAGGYLQAARGVETVSTINAFGLRRFVEERGGGQDYAQALSLHTRALHEAQNHLGKRARIVASLGPGRDCYHPAEALNRNEAREFHAHQASEAKRVNAELAWFETVNTQEEAVGIALAARAANVPCVISFVIGKNGKLLSGEPIKESIDAVDKTSGNYPQGFSFNCCAIEDLEPALQACGAKVNRIIAIYPNASSRPHAEIDGSCGVIELLDSFRTALYLNYLAQKYGIEIIGGCCGYTEKDIAEISFVVRRGLWSNELPLTDVSMTHA